MKLESAINWIRLGNDQADRDTSPSDTSNNPMPNADQRYPTSIGPRSSNFLPNTGKSVLKALVAKVYMDAAPMSIKMTRWRWST